MGNTALVRSVLVVASVAFSLWLVPTHVRAQGQAFLLPPMSDTIVRVAVAAGAGWTCELVGEGNADVDLLVFDASGQRLLVQDITVGARAVVTLPSSRDGGPMIMRLRNNASFGVNTVLVVQGQTVPIEVVSRQPIPPRASAARPPMAGGPATPPTSARPPNEAPTGARPPTPAPSPATPVTAPTPSPPSPPLPAPEQQLPNVGAPTTPASPGQFDALKTFIGRMRTAAGALRAEPDRAEVGQPVDVALTISPTSTEADLQRRTRTDGAVVATAPARIAPRMRAHLSVPEGATVAVIGSEDRAVHDTDDTIWQWTVTPSRPGELPLRAVLSAPVTIDGKDTAYDVRTFEARVTVFVTPATRVRDFLTSWQFLLSAVVLPVVGWVLTTLVVPRLRRGQRKQRQRQTAKTG